MRIIDASDDTARCHLSEGVHAGLDRHGHLILLDAVRDAYYSLGLAESRYFMKLLGCEAAQPVAAAMSQALDHDALLQEWMSAGLLQSGAGDLPAHIARAGRDSGLVNVRWRAAHPYRFSPSVTPLVLRALHYRLRAASWLKHRSIHQIVGLLSASTGAGAISSATPEQRYADACNAVNVACLLYPRPTLCLEWALTTCMLLRHLRAPVSLLIGVQSAPFMAHAWIERDGRVMGDQEGLADSMIRILEVQVCQGS